ncbi:hypothetical protein JZ785_21770 [Alicyclobacillus curvatus]|nr:hypothetical protein JZ785_21770 [Alicyclobacillus curvatus]
MKKKFPVFQTASLAVIAGLGVYALWNYTSSLQVSGHGTYKLSTDSTNANTASTSALSTPTESTTWNPNSNAYIQQLQQLKQQIGQQLQNEIQQLLQGAGAEQLFGQNTQSTSQLPSQLQSQWQQEQSQLQSLWQQAQAQLQNQLQQQLQSQPQSPNGWSQGQQSLLQNPPQGQASGQSVSLPPNTQASGNWAGYIDTPASGSYTSVSGAWTVPKITGNQNGVAAQWIGLGGVTNQDLLQMGTLEQFDNHGQPVAQVFWEKLPNAAQPVMTVPIGSTINAKISQASGSTWDITFSVHTPAGNNITKTVPVSLSSTYAAGIGTSAEWISEDPSDTNNNLYPLANMGTVNFTNAMVNGQAFGTQGNQVTPVALVDKYGELLIAPSAVSANGGSFSTDTLSTGLGGGGGQQQVGNGGQTLIPGYGYSGRHHHFRGQDGYTDYGSGYGFGEGFGG